MIFHVNSYHYLLVVGIEKLKKLLTCVWSCFLDAIASSDSVRVAPSLRSQKGAVWTKSKTNFDWWEVDISFRVSGRGRVGADGLAFWFTTEKGDYNGNVFGSSDRWNGLGIFFDSFDNDNKHNNPYIYGVVNDGNMNFDHQNDGGTQVLAGCLRDFRNKPYPTRAKIEYYQNVLTVLFNNGMTNNENEYEMCFRAENVQLPKEGYFGLSAATGGLADDHDVFHLLTTSLHAPGQLDPSLKQVPQADNDKLTQEYQDYQRKLDQKKEEYKKEHPDENKEDLEDWFESDNQRELRQIWQAQSATTEVLRDLSRKLDEVLGKQERTLGLISVSANQVAQPGQPGQHQPPPQYQQQQPTGEGIRRHEIDSLLNTNNILTQSIRDLKTQLNDLNQRTEVLIAQKNQVGGSAGGGYDMHGLASEMRDGLNNLKLGMQSVQSKVNQPQALGSCPSCLGLTPFLIAIAAQLLIMLGYSIYRESKNNQSKKFY